MTKRFLKIFALDSLRDLPQLEALKAGGRTRSEANEDVDAALDDALGMDVEAEEDEEPETPEFDDAAADRRWRESAIISKMAREELRHASILRKSAAGLIMPARTLRGR